MDKKITMEDITEEMRTLKEEMPQNKTIEYDWGWLETDYLGYPSKIKFKRKQINAFKRITKQFNKIPPMIKKGKVVELFGIKIVNSINVGEDTNG